MSQPPNSTASTSTSTNTAPVAAADTGRPRLQQYGGRNSPIRLTNWINLYEMVITDPAQRVRELMFYLKDEALAFFAQEFEPNMTYDVMKQRLLDRFGEPLVRPIIYAKKRYHRATESVQIYFDDKMKYMRQCQLTDADMVSMLTEGVHFALKPHLRAARPDTPLTWLAIAQELELDAERAKFRMKFKTKSSLSADLIRHVDPHVELKSNTKRLPPTPCAICKRFGKPKEMHWHSECPNKGKKAPNSGRPSNNTVEPTEDEAAFHALND